MNLLKKKKKPQVLCCTVVQPQCSQWRKSESKTEKEYSVKKTKTKQKPVQIRWQEIWVAFGPARLLCSKTTDSPSAGDWKEELTPHIRIHSIRSAQLKQHSAHTPFLYKISKTKKRKKKEKKKQSSPILKVIVSY